jgi:hypothetical protein
VVLYDLSSSHFEGTTCPLAALGHNRVAESDGGPHGGHAMLGDAVEAGVLELGDQSIARAVLR